MSTEKTFAKLADQFSELTDILLAISGTFRAAGDGGEEDGGDEPAGKKVRGAKPAAGKPAAKSKAKASEVTEDTVREKLTELADAKGAAVMKEALQAVGAGRLSDVGEDQYQELIDKAQELLDAEDAPPPKKKAAAKKAKPEPVDFDELTAKFKKLMKDDIAAAKAVLKANGVAKLAELDQDDEDALQEFSKALDEALGSDEDDLVG